MALDPPTASSIWRSFLDDTWWQVIGCKRATGQVFLRPLSFSGESVTMTIPAFLTLHVSKEEPDPYADSGSD